MAGVVAIVLVRGLTGAFFVNGGRGGERSGESSTGGTRTRGMSD